MLDLFGHRFRCHFSDPYPSNRQTYLVVISDRLSERQTHALLSFTNWAGIVACFPIHVREHIGSLCFPILVRKHLGSLWSSVSVSFFRPLPFKPTHTSNRPSGIRGSSLLFSATFPLVFGGGLARSPRPRPGRIDRFGLIDIFVPRSFIDLIFSSRLWIGGGMRWTTSFFRHGIAHLGSLPQGSDRADEFTDGVSRGTSPNTKSFSNDPQPTRGRTLRTGLPS